MFEKDNNMSINLGYSENESAKRYVNTYRADVALKALKDLHDNKLVSDADYLLNVKGIVESLVGVRYNT